MSGGLQAVDPHEAVCRQVRVRHDQLTIGSHQYSLERISRIVVVGAGKASARMAQALELRLGARIDTGLVVVKYGHGAPTNTIRIVEAGHPIPDAAGLQAGRMMMDLVRTLTPDDLLIVLLSGGASSLPAPVPGISLKDKQQTTKLRSDPGPRFRKSTRCVSISPASKADNLRLRPRRVASVILYRMSSNDFRTIGSGPTAPDPTTFRDASEIVARYGVARTIPASVRRYLAAGLKKDARRHREARSNAVSSSGSYLDWR